ncbi:TPA: Rha family transcriptional regulator [Citrobacter freundii]|nr:Rha family transcriptional regulator [Salmonella enterica]HCQ7277605.1 Rha family transcriptional regulator [Citrobacter freundii]
MNDYDLISLPERFLSADSKSLITNSLSLSTSFRIPHEHLLRHIENLSIPSDLMAPNIQKYEDNGKPAYKLTRDGMIFVVMQLPGREAALFKLAYINAFNEMSQSLYRGGDIDKVMAALHQLNQEELKAVMLLCLQRIA